MNKVIFRRFLSPVRLPIPPRPHPLDPISHRSDRVEARHGVSRC